MEINKILDLFPQGRKTRPNKFTLYIGKQIKEAREEAGLSQEKLAKKLYLRRPTLSDIEFSLEIQMHFEQIYGDDLKKLAIKIVKVIEKFNPSDLVKDLGPVLIAKSEDKEEIEKFLKELTFLLEE